MNGAVKAGRGAVGVMVRSERGDEFRESTAGAAVKAQETQSRKANCH